VNETSQTPGAAAKATVDSKTNKYSTLTQSYLFVPVVTKTVGAINTDGMGCLSDIGRRIAENIDDRCESTFLFL